MTLYELLPAIDRQRDAEQGYPLRALLDVLGEQAQVLEDDIGRLYDNSFIETCAAWAVPYIGALVGADAGASRAEVADTLAWRRRKGTLALLEELAERVAGWPARAVEFHRLLAWTQHLNHLHLQRGRTVDLRDGRALDTLAGPFDRLAHTVDVRRVGSGRGQGRYNIPSAALFVFRLRAYGVTQTPAYCHEGMGARRYHFSVLGNDAPLFILPVPETTATSIAQPVNLPQPIQRGWLHGAGPLYGDGASFAIYAPDWPRRGAPQPIPFDAVIAADLSDWRRYKVPRGMVAVDPVLGRIAFPDGANLKKGVTVSYQYGFSADMGGGEYARTLQAPDGARVLRVGRGEAYATISAALAAWTDEKPTRDGVLAAVIEVAASGVYTEALTIRLDPGESLQLRAASRARAVLRLLDQVADGADALTVEGGAASRFTLDGFVVTGRGLRIAGPDPDGGGAPGDLCDVRIRHCTLVPGWGVHGNCDPRAPTEPSIELINTRARLSVAHSIIGAIAVTADEVTRDPGVVNLADSIVDATAPGRLAVSSNEQGLAFATLHVARCTVIGQVLVHAVALAEDTLFTGTVRVARRQVGCLRFCYVAAASRTPRRFHCVSDPVQPRFTSLRYGAPGYCQLHTACAAAIAGGASDQSELGAFHDLYQPQRAASLRARLQETSPAAMEAGIVYANQEM